MAAVMQDTADTKELGALTLQTDSPLASSDDTALSTHKSGSTA